MQEELRVAQLMVTPQHVADQSMADTTHRGARGWARGYPDQPMAGEEAGASPVAKRCPSPPAHPAPTP